MKNRLCNFQALVRKKIVLSLLICLSIPQLNAINNELLKAGEELAAAPFVITYPGLYTLGGPSVLAVAPAIAIATETERVNPATYVPTPLPENLQKAVASIVSSRSDFFKQLLGTAPHRPLAELIQEDKDNRALLQDTPGVHAFTGGNSNLVFHVDELSGWLFKVVGRYITLAQFAELLGKQGELNEKGHWAFAQKADEYAKDANINPYKTYHLISTLLGVELVKQAQSQYQIEDVEAPETYGYRLDPTKSAHDRNCFIVQRVYEGKLLPNILSGPSLSESIILSSRLSSLFKLVLAAKLWQVHDIMLTNDRKIVPLDLEGRDWPRIAGGQESEHHQEYFLTSGESQHRAQCAFEEAAKIFNQNPALFARWEYEVSKHQELQNLLRSAKHIADLYPCLTQQ